MNVTDLPIDLIDPPANPHRLSIDPTELDELASDIRTHGLQQPLLVREKAGRYEVIFGHRRLLALRSISARVAPCAVEPGADDATVELLRWSENLHRAGLTPMEEALQLATLLTGHKLTIELAARKLNRTPFWVRQRLTLLDLPDELKGAVHRGDLKIGAAVALLEITDTEHRAHLANYAITSGATVRVVEEWVRSYLAQRAAQPAGEPALPPMPDPGQPIIVVVPCYLCGDHTDHRRMMIRRVCTTCDEKVRTAATGA